MTSDEYLDGFDEERPGLTRREAINEKRANCGLEPLPMTYPSATIEKLRTFRALILDADGVWFDGKETRSADGVVSKTRDLRDGQGLSFLRAMGVRVLFVSGESVPLIAPKLNTLPSCLHGAWSRVHVVSDLTAGKVAACEQWLQEQTTGGDEGVSQFRAMRWADVVYCGDDRSDCEAMRACAAGGGLVVVPSDAQRVARKLAHLVLTKPGGGGAIRELAEMVCDARGVDEESLATA